MSHEHHDHGHHHNHQTHPKRPIHHSLWFWVAVGLMLLGMGAYVITNDEALPPGGGDEPAMPAIAE